MVASSRVAVRKLKRCTMWATVGHSSSSHHGHKGGWKQPSPAGHAYENAFVSGRCLQQLQELLSWPWVGVQCDDCRCNLLEGLAAA
jgi:hypothetical protein